MGAPGDGDAPASQSGWQALVAKGGNNGPYPPSLWMFGDKVQVWFSPRGTAKATSVTGLEVNKWYHLAATYDGSKVKIYINGNLDVEAAQTATPANNAEPLTIGQRNDGDMYFQGMIDEVEIFNRALTPDEIRSIFDAGRAGKIKPAIALNSANGHVYEVVFGPEPFPWYEAKAQAKSRSFGGRQGHLATITSQAENDFIAASFPDAASGCCWLGGNQPGDTPAPNPDPAAGSQWVTDEPFTYTNWAGGEPNDAGGQEDSFAFLPEHPGEWNDVPGAGKVGGYVVEYE